MSVSRRRLFGLIVVAPIAAVKAAQGAPESQVVLRSGLRYVGDAVQTRLYPGAINWVDPDYDERTGEVLKPLIIPTMA